MAECPNCNQNVEYQPQLNQTVGYLSYQERTVGILDQDGRKMNGTIVEFYCPICNSLVTTNEADAVEFVGKRA